MRYWFNTDVKVPPLEGWKRHARQVGRLQVSGANRTGSVSHNRREVLSASSVICSFRTAWDG
jgi:hypothetical protein